LLSIQLWFTQPCLHFGRFPPHLIFFFPDTVQAFSSSPYPMDPASILSICRFVCFHFRVLAVCFWGTRYSLCKAFVVDGHSLDVYRLFSHSVGPGSLFGAIPELSLSPPSLSTNQLFLGIFCVNTVFFAPLVSDSDDVFAFPPGTGRFFSFSVFLIYGHLVFWRVLPFSALCSRY